MPAFRLFPLALATLLLPAAPAHAATAEPAISVEYIHPENFRDVGDRFAGGAQGAAYLKELNAFLVRRAARLLAPGQTLRVAVTEVDLAGEFEHRRGSFGDVRVVREVYPPRIDLRFVLLDENGAVRKEGERKLRDAGFMFAASPLQGDPLRFDKALLDNWLEREFAPAP